MNEDLGELTRSELTRREFLLGSAATLAAAAAGCATAIPKEDLVSLRNIVVPGAKNIKRIGPDLAHTPPAITNAPGFGTYARHRAVMTTGGIDFSISDNADIYPVANGIVTVVKEFSNDGKVITIYHGLYWSNYAHLAEQLVRHGQYVFRNTRIGIGGQTGSGARFGPHLHLNFATTEIAKLLNLVHDIGLDGYYYFDSVDFAARRTTDSFGNLTLPYWYGDEIDGPLDSLFNKHYESKLKFFNEKLKVFPNDQIENYLGLFFVNNAQVRDFDRRHGIDERIGQKLMFLYNRIKSGKHPFNQADAQKIMAESKDFLSIHPLLTAPKRNPSMTNLYS